MALSGLIVDAVDRGSHKRAPEKRTDTAVADEREIAALMIRNDPAGGGDDAGLCIHCTFPAAKTGVGMREEPVRCGFEFGREQEARGAAIIFAQIGLNGDRKRPGGGEGLGGFAGLPLIARPDVGNGGQNGRCRTCFGPAEAHIIQPPVRDRDRGIDGDLGVGDEHEARHHASGNRTGPLSAKAMRISVPGSSG